MGGVSDSVIFLFLGVLSLELPCKPNVTELISLNLAIYISFLYLVFLYPEGRTHVSYRRSYMVGLVNGDQMCHLNAKYKGASLKTECKINA